MGGVFYDFCEAAIRWVVLGIGVAFALTYMSQKDKVISEKRECKLSVCRYDNDRFTRVLLGLAFLFVSKCEGVTPLRKSKNKVLLRICGNK